MKALAFVFLPVLLAYGATLRWIGESWVWRDSYYQHGILVPPLAAILLWRQRRDWGVAAAVADPRGWWLLAPGLGLHLAGGTLMIDSLSAASALLSLPGAVWLALGRARLCRVLPVLGLAVFAIPLPIFVTGRVVFELKEAAIGAGVALANALGVPVVRASDGLHVAPETTPLVVADACSGLRSLLALTTLGYCVAFFLGRKPVAHRVALLVAAVPIAVAMNVLRIAGACWLAHACGVEFAAGTGHDLLNVGAWLLDLALLLCLDLWLSRRRRQPP